MSVDALRPTPIDAPMDESAGSRESVGMGRQQDNHHAEHAAAALCDLRHKRTRHASIRRVGAYAPLAIIEDGSVLHLKQPLNALIETLFETRVEFHSIQGAMRANRLMPPRSVESLDRLCWLFGARFARERGLLPWLSERGCYRLLAWPDFGEIGSDPKGAAFCTLLAREPLSPQQVAHRLRLHSALVFGLFNSAALCGVLVAEGSVRRIKHHGVLTMAQKVNVQNRKSLFFFLWRRLKG